MTSLSGYQFVHHLFDATLSLVHFMSKPKEEKIDESARNSAVLDSRLSVLEHHFASFRSQNEIEFAIQQELNDWNENKANEHFLVLSGLPPAPPKLTGGFLHS